MKMFLSMELPPQRMVGQCHEVPLFSISWDGGWWHPQVGCWGGKSSQQVGWFGAFSKQSSYPNIVEACKICKKRRRKKRKKERKEEKREKKGREREKKGERKKKRSKEDTPQKKRQKYC